MSLTSKVCGSRFLMRSPLHLQPGPGMGRSGQCPSWAAYIMITVEPPEKRNPQVNAKRTPKVEQPRATRPGLRLGVFREQRLAFPWVGEENGQEGMLMS